MSVIDTTKLTTEKLALHGPVGPLEALLESPPGSVAGLAVICHPHPLYGGNLNNKVVLTLARAFNQCEVASLRFNFRGVGASSGTYDDGKGETEDALAVLDWAAGRWPGSPLFLAGFSFGGAVAIRAAGRRAIQRLVSVAPAVERLGAEAHLPECPWVLIQGSADEVLDAPATERWAASLPRPPRLIMLDGVGHFFHGQLTRLKDVVVQWLQS